MFANSQTVTDKTFKELDSTQFHGGFSIPLKENEDLILYGASDRSGDLSSITYLVCSQDEIKYERTFKINDAKARKYIDYTINSGYEYLDSDDIETKRAIFLQTLIDSSDLIRRAHVVSEGVENFSWFSSDRFNTISALGFAIPAWEALRLSLRALGFQNPVIDHTGDTMNGYLNHILAYFLIRILTKESPKYHPSEIAFFLSSLSVVIAETSNAKIFGTSDPRDIPAGILGAAVGWAFTKCASRSLAASKARDELEGRGFFRSFEKDFS